MRALPELAVRTIGERAQAVADLAEELETVTWDRLPDPMQLCAFWPMGLDGRGVSPMSGYPAGRMIVVSPFVTQEALAGLLSNRSDSVLVTRAATLRTLGREGIAAAQQTYVLKPGLATPVSDDAAMSTDETTSSQDLHDLHAKFYAIDTPDGARMWTGSANATDAGFDANVEFLVELRSTDRRHTVAAMLEPGPANRPSFGSMFEEWVVDEDAEEETEADKADRKLGSIARSLGGLVWQARARLIADDAFTVMLVTRGDELPVKEPGLTASIRLLSASSDSAWPVNLQARSVRVRFDCPFSRLSAFFVLDLNLTTATVKRGRSVLIAAELTGVPLDRLARLQAAGLDGGGFYHLMLLLLGTADPVGGDAMELRGGGEWLQTARSGPFGPETLLEPLLRTLARTPARFSEFQKLLADLQRTPEGHDMLPPGWADLWKAITGAQRGRRDG